jgi:hypothetical protein
MAQSQYPTRQPVAPKFGSNGKNFAEIFHRKPISVSTLFADVVNFQYPDREIVRKVNHETQEPANHHHNDSHHIHLRSTSSS